MGHPRSLLCLFSPFQTNVFTKNKFENIYPVYGVAIWNHDHWNMSLLPQPQDQGSRPPIRTLIHLKNYDRFCDIAVFPLKITNNVGLQGSKPPLKRDTYVRFI